MSASRFPKSTRQKEEAALPYLWLLALLQECIFALLFPALLLPGKVLGAADLLQSLLVNAANVDLCGCGNDVSCVHSADGHTVDLEGAGHQQGAFLQVLEEDDSLAAESTGEENEDSARLQSGSGFGFAGGLAGLKEVTYMLAVVSERIETGDQINLKALSWNFQGSASHLSTLWLIVCRVEFPRSLRVMRDTALTRAEFLRHSRVCLRSRHLAYELDHDCLRGFEVKWVDGCGCQCAA
jgi:hypothetical protein